MLPASARWQYDPAMGTGDGAEPTEVADAVAVAAAEPTELAGVAEADTQSAYAWSLDDGPDELEPERQWPFWTTVAALGVSLSLVTIAGVLAYRHLGDQDSAPIAATSTTVSPPPKAAPQPSPAAPPPVTVTTVVIQAPPSTVTAQQLPPPNANPSAPALTDTDWRFLSRLQGEGWIISDPVLFAYRGHETCAMLRNGEPTTLVQQKLMQLDGVTNGKDAWSVIDAAMATYPNCP